MVPIISSIPMTMFIMTNIKIIIPSMFLIFMFRFCHRTFLTTSTIFWTTSIRICSSISIFNTHSSRSCRCSSSTTMSISNTSRSMFIFSMCPIISIFIIMWIVIRFNISFFRTPTTCLWLFIIWNSCCFTPTISSTRSIIIWHSFIRPIISCCFTITISIFIIGPIISNIMYMIFMRCSWTRTICTIWWCLRSSFRSYLYWRWTFTLRECLWVTLLYTLTWPIICYGHSMFMMMMRMSMMSTMMMITIRIWTAFRWLLTLFPSISGHDENTKRNDKYSIHIY